MQPAMTYYPGFMFHLRRSQFVQARPWSLATPALALSSLLPAVLLRCGRHAFRSQTGAGQSTEMRSASHHMICVGPDLLMRLCCTSPAGRLSGALDHQWSCILQLNMESLGMPGVMLYLLQGCTHV